MQETGKVIEAYDDRALVEIQRSEACKHCEHSCGLAGDKVKIDELEVDVSNPIGAQKGDRVSLEMGARQVYFASITVYLIPPLIMILGYFLSMFVAEAIFGPQHEAVGIAGAFLAFILAMLGIKKLDKRLKSNSKFDPKIIKVISD